MTQEVSNISAWRLNKAEQKELAERVAKGESVRKQPKRTFRDERRLQMRIARKRRRLLQARQQCQKLRQRKDRRR